MNIITFLHIIFLINRKSNLISNFLSTKIIFSLDFKAAIICIADSLLSLVLFRITITKLLLMLKTKIKYLYLYEYANNFNSNILNFMWVKLLDN